MSKDDHHTQSHIYGSEAEYYDELLGRGAGDFDMYDDPQVVVLADTLDLSEAPF